MTLAEWASPSPVVIDGVPIPWGEIVKGSGEFHSAPYPVYTLFPKFDGKLSDTYTHGQIVESAQKRGRYFIKYHPKPELIGDWLPVRSTFLDKWCASVHKGSISGMIPPPPPTCAHKMWKDCIPGRILRRKYETLTGGPGELYVILPPSISGVLNKFHGVGHAADTRQLIDLSDGSNHWNITRSTCTDWSIATGVEITEFFTAKLKGQQP